MNKAFIVVGFVVAIAVVVAVIVLAAANVSKREEERNH